MAAEATSSNAPSLFTQMRPKEEPGPIPEKVAEREGRAIGVSLIDIGGVIIGVLNLVGGAAL